MSQPRLIELNCWVLGDGSSDVFPVEIAENKTVGTLKDKIMEKNPDLGNCPARHLTLWKVSVPCTRQLAEKVAELKLNGREPLSAVEVVSEVFNEELVRKNVHIVVRAPTGECSQH